jgi:hypothetical protein
MSQHFSFEGDVDTRQDDEHTGKLGLKGPNLLNHEFLLPT